MAAHRGERKVAAWRSLLEAHARILDRLAGELEREMALPITFYDVLLHLNEAQGHRLPMRDLADRVLLSKSGLTRLVDRMAADGLVDRQPCDDDRRVVHAVLTEKGRSRLVGAAPVHLRGIEQHFGQHLSEDEAETLRELLERLVRANGPAAEPLAQGSSAASSATRASRSPLGSTG